MQDGNLKGCGKFVKTAALCLALTLGVSTPAFAKGSWQQTAEGGFSYTDVSGIPAAPGWLNTDGAWYLIGEDGFRKTGWILEGEDWYYLDDTGVMATGWKNIDGKYYYFLDNGTMYSNTLRKEETQYSFNADGSLASVKKEKNTGGGGYTIGFYDSDRQALADNLNELKADAFDGNKEEDYYEDDKKDYDKDASFVINGKLQEIAEHRLTMARTKGYGSGRIPDEGTLEDYLKSIGYGSGRRILEVYLMNCDGADAAEDKLLRNHDSDEKKRSDRVIYYKEMGIAHKKVNGKDYYMVIFMR